MDDTIGWGTVAAWLRTYARAIAAHRDELTELDAAIGDADHGINMDRGMQAVIARLDQLPPADIGALLKAVGMTLVSTVGGAAGPLYGTLFLQMGVAAGPAAELSLTGWTAAFDAGVRGVQARGKAQRGDKTMLDALLPAVEALRVADVSGRRVDEALRLAAAAADEGARATIPLVARKGRASYLGERSVGHQDPGATSSALLLATAAVTLAGGRGQSGEPG